MDNKKLADSTLVKMSNNQHRKLGAMYRKLVYTTPRDERPDRYSINAMYHSRVAVLQDKNCRVLTDAEKKDVYFAMRMKYLSDQGGQQIPGRDIKSVEERIMQNTFVYLLKNRR